ncbi:hypothetical protein [Actinoplanes sp. NPDC051851]|uniref:hypothetical protein n=1 Tax=Actinoplanes sp. NPDC051851 TaxID=3154753 RepID=UPI00343A0DFF
MRTKTAITLLGLSLVAGGCSSGSGTPSSTASPTTGSTWSVIAQGSATPSPTPSMVSGLPAAAVSASLPSASPTCSTQVFTRDTSVMIALKVTVGTGSVKVEWPTQYDSDYRVAAVPQQLVSGAQPEPAWKSVAAGTGCTVSATLTGLTAGAPYIVWLEALHSGYELDGTRHLYSGRSGVIYPK